jgi:hypothetical protein
MINLRQLVSKTANFRDLQSAINPIGSVGFLLCKNLIQYAYGYTQGRGHQV